MNNEFLPAYKVYQQVIDLELYYAFVDLVVHTSQEEKAWEIYRNIVDTQIWQQKAEGQNYFEAYNLRYPGEVLERFEEKLGKDVRIIRALALALGKTRALQSDNMFVGNQRGSFLQMIRRTSNGDVYLQGALYLLETDMPRRHALLDELAATEYAKTEDALFVLSLFDDQEEGYRTMHSQLLRLLGKERTLSLPENCGVLEWLVQHYAPYIKSYRGKSDLALLVERKEIRLWQFFEQHQEDGPSAQSMKLLLGYAMNISSWQGFRFVRRLLQKYTPVQLQKFFGERFFFHELFVRGNRYSSRDYELFIKRSFLTEEQHRQLFEWIDTSFFQMEPERYQEFIWCALQNSDVQRLYDRRLLASVLRSLLSSGKYAGCRADHLKEKLYSKEELEADQKADAEKAEREERLRREQEHQKKCERLEQTYDGTMSSLKEFTKSFYYDRDVKEAMDMVYEKLREQPAGCAAAFAADELEQFFKLCGDLARYNPGDEQKILNMARTMMGGLAA